MKRKNGDVTVGTLVSIVLAIVVIAFLVYGFSTGWTNLWGKVTDFGGGDSNVDDIVLACQLACAQQRTNEFCAVEKTVKFGNSETAEGSCEALRVSNVKNIDIDDCGAVTCTDVKAATCNKIAGLDVDCKAVAKTAE